VDHSLITTIVELWPITIFLYICARVFEAENKRKILRKFRVNIELQEKLEEFIHSNRREGKTFGYR
jgi:hypothetical protein